jgi:hypothetical protein
MSGSNASTRRVLPLLYTNLTISVAIAVLTFVNWSSVIGFEVAHSHGNTRDSIAIVTGVVSAVVLVFSLLSLRIAAALGRGKRSTYYRLLALAIIGIVGIAFPTISAQYPIWMRLGHAAQELVLIGLLITITRSSFRAHFAKAGRQVANTRSASPVAL